MRISVSGIVRPGHIFQDRKIVQLEKINPLQQKLEMVKWLVTPFTPYEVTRLTKFCFCL